MRKKSGQRGHSDSWRCVKIQSVYIIVTHFFLLGEDASPGQWPWMASLWYSESESGVLRIECGGTLVSVSHVLTAAHCVTERDQNLMQIRLGDTDFRFL